MFKDSFILNSLNKFFEFSQNKSEYLWNNSFFLQNIDNIIFAAILGVFFLSTFASSDSIGYLALVTVFLSVIKLFLKKGERLEINLFETFLLIYFLAVTISLFGSTLFVLSFKGFLKVFTYLGFYFSIMQYYKNNLSKIPYTLGFVALCAFSQGMIGIYQNFGQVSEISTWQDTTNLNPEEVMTRVYGTLNPYNPNLLGGYLVATLPCLLGTCAWLSSAKKYLWAILFFVMAVITSITLILTGCRGAYVGFAVILGAVFAHVGHYIWHNLENKKELFKKLYLSVAGAMSMFVVSAVCFVSSIRARVFSIFAMRADSSTSFRMNVYHSAVQMLQDNWLLGIGIGNQNFREIYGLYMKTGFDALSCYNVFLEIGVESGIFALIAFIAFLIVFAKSAVKFILKSTDLKATIIVAASLFSVTAVMIHGLVDTVFFRPQIQLVFWLMVSFASAYLSKVSTFDK